VRQRLHQSEAVADEGGGAHGVQRPRNELGALSLHRDLQLHRSLHVGRQGFEDRAVFGLGYALRPAAVGQHPDQAALVAHEDGLRGVGRGKAQTIISVLEIPPQFVVGRTLKIMRRLQDRRAQSQCRTWIDARVAAMNSDELRHGRRVGTRHPVERNGGVRAHADQLRPDGPACVGEGVQCRRPIALQRSGRQQFRHRQRVFVVAQHVPPSLRVLFDF
jgi:hypothetical protein